VNETPVPTEDKAGFRADAFVGAGWSALLIAVVWWSTVFVPGPGDVVSTIPLTTVAVLLLIVTSIALLLRRRWPVLTLAVTATVDAYSIIAKSIDGAGYHYAALFGVFFVAVRHPFRRTCLAVGLSMGLVYLSAVANADWRWTGFGPMGVIVTTLLATSFGQVRYLREHLVRSLHEQVESAELTREAVARTRVAEDRLHTARELHDLVGHRIAVVHLRAAAAIRTVESDPPSALRALRDIDDAARDVLHDIDQLLADLRAGDTRADEPDLGQLDDLIDEFRRYGLDIRTDVSGDLGAVPVSTSRVTYQVVHESLTNALKHGRSGGPVALVLHVARASVSVRVSNASADTSATDPREGWGLHGIRERVADVDGSVTVDPGPEFVVDVALPIGGRP
jgi:signal transduction histidine kinase